MNSMRCPNILLINFSFFKKKTLANLNSFLLLTIKRTISLLKVPSLNTHDLYFTVVLGVVGRGEEPTLMDILSLKC